jgi:hypothetical protein
LSTCAWSALICACCVHNIEMSRFYEKALRPVDEPAPRPTISHNSLMTTKRSALDWGDPDAITNFNPGNRSRYAIFSRAHPTRSLCSIQVTRTVNVISYGNTDGSLVALPLLFAAGVAGAPPPVPAVLSVAVHPFSEG